MSTACRSRTGWRLAWLADFAGLLGLCSKQFYEFTSVRLILVGDALASCVHVAIIAYFGHSWPSTVLLDPRITALGQDAV